MRKFAIAFAVMAAVMIVGVASGVRAATLTDGSAVTRQWVTMYEYRYTVHATPDAGVTETFNAQGRDPNGYITVTGGCKNVYTKVRTRSIYQNTQCTNAGTVTFQSPILVACEQAFNITLNGAVIYTDFLNPNACPPPPPPPVQVTHTDPTITLYNPADVAQPASVQFVVAAADSSIQADGDVTYWVTTEFAASGPNHYVYFLGHVSATLDPGQTITIVTQPGSPELIGDTLYVCQGVMVSKPYRHCLGTWMPVPVVAS